MAHWVGRQAGRAHCAEPILWAVKKDEKDIKDKKDRVSLA